MFAESGDAKDLEYQIKAEGLQTFVICCLYECETIGCSDRNERPEAVLRQAHT